MRRRAAHEPPAEACDLLRACLATRERPRREAWAALAGSWELLRDPVIRRAGLMAQLAHASELAGIELDPEVRSMLRTARVHEELRLEALAPACREHLEGVDRDAIVLRGLALSHTVYDDPALRHCHDLDLLVPGPGGQELHPSGLPISRHVSLFGPGAPPVLWAEVSGGAVEAEVAGAAARVLPAPEALVHVCVHGSHRGWAHSPLWCLDAALLIRRSPALDWDRVVRRARDWAVAAPAHRALRWLRDGLGVEVPDAPLAGLSRRGVLARGRRRLSAGLALGRSSPARGG